jgi:hypothetical protein
VGSSGIDTVKYWVQVARETAFLNVVKNDTVGNNDTTYLARQLDYLTKHFWRVKAFSKDKRDSSDFSDIGSFTTDAPPPPVPTLVSPSNNAADVEARLTLSWNASTGAASYDLQVSTSHAFDALAVDSNVTGAKSLYVRLEGFSTYYWRVRAIKAGNANVSDWSEVWKFTTKIGPPAAPVLLSPSNGAINLKTSPIFRWNPSATALLYGLQISSDTLSSDSIVYNAPNIQLTSQQVTGLLINKKYYWRVNAWNRGGDSDWSLFWSFRTVEMPPPGPPKLLKPDSGAAAVALDTSFVWKGLSDRVLTGDTSYSIQVSSNSSFTSLVMNDSVGKDTVWRLSGLAPGAQYFWRVSATNIAGTGNWSNVWSFTTKSAQPSVPTQTSPPNDTTGVPADSAEFTWSYAVGAVSYHLQVCTDSSRFQNTLVSNDSGLAGITHKLRNRLSFATKYYWRIRSKNPFGTSGWSSVWSFTTIAALPSVPTLASPIDIATGVPISPAFSWNNSNGATSYDLQVSESPTFSSPVVNDTGIIGKSRTILTKLQNNAMYYWQVRARNSIGTSGWSSIWSFTTSNLIPPPTPVIFSPANGATGISTKPTFSWNASDGAASYHLHVSAGDFSSVVVNDSGITETSHISLSSLLNNTSYNWRVRAKNAAGTSSWSNVWSFTTRSTPTPPAPALHKPENGAVDVSTDTTLLWHPSVGADSGYALQVSNSVMFSSLVINRTAIKDTSQRINGLANNTTYYWRVAAANAGGVGAWSDSWNFITVFGVPGKPSLAFPTNGAVHIKPDTALTWQPSVGAASYRVQVGTDSNFISSSAIDTSVSSSTSCSLGKKLKYNTLYYWRVQAANSNGSSSWSEVWSFTTGVQPPLPPQLVAPSNGVLVTLATQTLTWSKSAAATSYEIQVGIDSSFTPPLWQERTAPDTFLTVIGLIHGTTYYWRVKASNEAGTSLWSSVWSFYKAPEAPPPPQLISPLPGKTNIPIEMTTLKWNSSVRAVSYRLQVSTYDVFVPTTVDIDGLTGTSFTIPRLYSSTDYYWRVKAFSLGGGESDWSDTWGFTTMVVSSVQQIGDAIPNDYGLSQNYPNPFNPTTSIEFGLPQSGHVTLKVYNLLGKEIATLVSGGLSAGRYRVNWNASDAASGIYYYRLQSGKFVVTKKLAVVK